MLAAVSAIEKSTRWHQGGRGAASKSVVKVVEVSVIRVLFLM